MADTVQVSSNLIRSSGNGMWLWIRPHERVRQTAFAGGVAADSVAPVMAFPEAVAAGVDGPIGIRV